MTRTRRTPLGARLHELRVNRDLTLRGLADELRLDFTYLSKIENGADKPGEETLRGMAAFFEVDADELLALAGRVPPELADRARREPNMGRLLRRLPDMSPDKMRKIYEVAGIDEADEATE